MRPGRARASRRAWLLFPLFATLLLGACSTYPSWVPSWVPTIPVPSLPWIHKTKKPGPLPEFTAKATPRVLWQLPLGGKTTNAFAPAVVGSTVYAAGADGAIVAAEAQSGRLLWRADAARRLSAGVGAGDNLVVAGTDKGEVLAFDFTGKAIWEARVSSEVAGPPRVSDGVAATWSLDGKIFGLAVADGSRRWVYQRSTPPLTVRRFPGGVVARGALFTGTSGGKLLAIDLTSGALGWEGNVATPKGATELERIADVTSLPLIDSRQVCAIAFQGRLACFEPNRGVLQWSRDVSSLAGMTGDNRYVYLTDDAGAIQALDNQTGASVWKQDKLAARFPGAPVVLGDYLGIVDAEGFLHLLDRNDGSLAGRVPTDGTPPLTQPVTANDVAYWQTAGGALVAAAAR